MSNPLEQIKPFQLTDYSDYSGTPLSDGLWSPTGRTMTELSPEPKFVDFGNIWAAAENPTSQNSDQSKLENQTDLGDSTEANEYVGRNRFSIGNSNSNYQRQSFEAFCGQDRRDYNNNRGYGPVYNRGYGYKPGDTPPAAGRVTFLGSTPNSQNNTSDAQPESKPVVTETKPVATDKEKIEKLVDLHDSKESKEDIANRRYPYGDSSTNYQSKTAQDFCGHPYYSRPYSSQSPLGYENNRHRYDQKPGDADQAKSDTKPVVSPAWEPKPSKHQP